MTIYLGENIKRLRLGRNITQETLAEFLGVTFQSVSRWERGEGYPDITVLPSIASFFDVTVDSLLGVDKAKKEDKIKEYLKLYDNIRLKEADSVFAEFKKSVKEFPGDFRILIRYMELLETEKGYPLDPDYEKASKELMSIYENIQKHCTDDAIRIWAKRIIIKRLMKTFDCTCNEEGKYRVFTQYLEQAESIIQTLPAMSDSKEYLSFMYSRGDECKPLDTIGELLHLLCNTVFYHCSSNPDYTKENNIDLLNCLLGLINTLYTDGNYGKNSWWRLYNYGHLGRFYYEAGDKENALINLKIAAEYAAELDKNPDLSQQAAWFYERSGIYRETNASQFMKTVMTEHYGLSDEFKAKEEFKEIIEILDK